MSTNAEMRAKAKRKLEEQLERQVRQAQRRRMIVPVAGAFGVFAALAIGSGHPLQNLNERAYARVAHEMLERRDFIVATLNGVPISRSLRSRDPDTERHTRAARGRLLGRLLGQALKHYEGGAAVRDRPGDSLEYKLTLWALARDQPTAFAARIQFRARSQSATATPLTSIR